MTTQAEMQKKIGAAYDAGYARGKKEGRSTAMTVSTEELRNAVNNQLEHWLNMIANEGPVAYFDDIDEVTLLIVAQLHLLDRRFADIEASLDALVRTR